MDKDIFFNLVEQRFPSQYDDKGKEVLFEEYSKAGDPIKEDVGKYLNEGTVSDIEVEGYSIESLKNDHGMNELAALFTIDYLMKDPIAAKASLSKGHDSVSIN